MQGTQVMPGPIPLDTLREQIARGHYLSQGL